MSLTLSTRAMAILPSVTLAIDAKAKALQASGVNVIGFGAGEPDFPTPSYICEAAKVALDRGMTRYTPVAGTLELRKKIAEKLQKENGLTYSPAEIIVSGGAKQSLYHALCAIINLGDEVLLPAPCWVSYPEMIRMAGGIPILVHGEEKNNFVVTADMLAPYVTSRTKALILNSPNNPTGNVTPRAALQGIAKLAVDKQFYVISDEIYEKLIYDGQEHVSIASLGNQIKAQTIVVNGVSKSYAMTGWRIGYAAGAKDVIDAMVSYQSHSASNPNSIAQFATIAALSGGEEYLTEMVEEFDERRKLMHKLVNEIPGLRANMPEGAFYAMVNISGVVGKKYKGRVIDGSMAFAELLLDNKNVAVVPAKAFEADMHVRLSYAQSREAIVEGLKRIAEFVSELEG